MSDYDLRQPIQGKIVPSYADSTEVQSRSASGSIARFKIDVELRDGKPFYTKPFNTMVATFNINDYTADELEAVATHRREHFEQ